MAISNSDFEALARAFAVTGSTDALSWAWVSPAVGGAFAPPLGYLRSSQMHVSPPLGAPRATSAEPAGELLTEPEDPASLPPPRGGRDLLTIHICLSQAYRTPLLLLLGCSSTNGGLAWGTEEASAYVRSCAGAAAESLPPDVVTQAEHPALGGPCCALHPCRTADVLKLMLSTAGDANGPSGADSGCGGGDAGAGLHAGADGPGAPPQLDALCAWWSLVAPLVGLKASNQQIPGQSGGEVKERLHHGTPAHAANYLAAGGGASSGGMMERLQCGTRPVPTARLATADGASKMQVYCTVGYPIGLAGGP